MSAAQHLDAETLTRAVSPDAAVEAIAAALRDGYDPARDIARTTAHTSSGHFLLMPTELGEVAGVKVATVAPENPSSGLPRIQATYLLYDAKTLTLRATLDGTALTTLRTPAVSMAAVRPLLDRFEPPLRVVVFGTGPQAVGHVRTLAAVSPAPLGPVTFVARRPHAAGEAVRTLGDVVEIGSPEAAAALRAAQLVICATSARTPLFPADAVGSNVVVIAVGSHQPDARELEGALLARSVVVVEDADTALREAGDVVLAVDEGAVAHADLIPMTDLVARGRVLAADRPVVFKGVGMSWQDLCVARVALLRSGHGL